MPSYQPDVTLWCRHYCPVCGVKNWTCHGSTLDDGTDGDIGSCQCWTCGETYWLLDKDLADDLYQSDIEASNTARGKENP
jgi:hypothetical protein